MKKHIGLIALIAVVLSACSGSGGEENESTPPTVFKWKNEHSYSTDEFTIVAMCGSMYSGSVTKEEALEALTFQRITNPEIKLSKQNCAKLAYKVSVGQLKKQIEKGGPVTVTHPDMKRFFMTIPEAVSLILQAEAYAKGGDLFVLDMGEQISIDKLARDMITLAGFVPDQDIKVVYTGIRPGEKLFEELYYPDEERVSTSHPKVFRIVSENDLDPDEVEEYMKSLEEHLRKAEVSGILEIIRRLVPQARINFTKGEEKV